MFKKKKKVQPTTNPAINNRIQYLHESTFTLEKRVLDTYVANLAVNLYQKGTPDWTKAKRDVITAQNNLLSQIARYDDIHAEIMNEAKRLNVKLPFHIPTSHSIVEQIMKRIVCGGVL